MGNKVKRAALAALVGGTVFGGCLNMGGWWGRAMLDAAMYTGLEYVTDQDGVFDLFEDGEPTATTEE